MIATSDISLRHRSKSYLNETQIVLIMSQDSYDLSGMKEIVPFQMYLAPPGIQETMNEGKVAVVSFSRFVEPESAVVIEYLQHVATGYKAGKYDEGIFTEKTRNLENMVCLLDSFEMETIDTIIGADRYMVEELVGLHQKYMQQEGYEENQQYLRVELSELKVDTSELGITTDQDLVEGLRNIRPDEIKRHSKSSFLFRMLIQEDQNGSITPRFKKEDLRQRVDIEGLRNSKAFHLDFDTRYYPADAICNLLDGTYEIIDEFSSIANENDQRIPINADRLLDAISLDIISIPEKLSAKEKAQRTWADSAAK